MPVMWKSAGCSSGGPLDLEFEVRMECVEVLKTQCELPNNQTCIWWVGEWRVL
jgi:hypothetical protein